MNHTPAPTPQRPRHGDAVRGMPPHLRLAWRRTLLVLLGLLGAAITVGLVLSQVGWVLAVTALGILAWHYWRLRRVLLGLTARQRWVPARGAGAWNELDHLLHRSQTEMRARKRRLLEMLRAYRAAAAALPDAIVVVDRNTQRTIWFNRAASSLLGLRYPQDLHASVVERLQPFVEFETWERRGDGTTVIRLMTSWATPESDIEALAATFTALYTEGRAVGAAQQAQGA